MNYDFLINKIKEKKTYNGLNDLIIKSEIKRYFLRNPNDLKKLDKKIVIKKVVKEVRNNLRKGYEQFQVKKDYSKLKVSEILKLHKSTKERLPYYKIIYKKIFKITGKPRSILDLGCGVNPLSFPDKKIRYYASDIGEKEINYLKSYFKKNKINGEAFIYDLKLIRKDLPKVDVVFLFKVFDSIESKNHRLSEKIIKMLNCNYSVVSFSTLTVSGKKMNFPYRGWFERMLNRLELKFEKFEVPNEVFYVIEHQL